MQMDNPDRRSLDIIASTWYFSVDHMEFSTHASVIHNFGNNEFSEERQNFVDREVVDIGAGDFDQDGDLDLAVLSFKPGDDFYDRRFRIFVLMNSGLNRFSLGQEIIGEGYFIWPGYMSRMLAVTDLTDDGIPDLSVLADGGTLSVFINGGQGRFTQTINRGVVDFVGELGDPVSLLSGDFNADGLQDLAFTVSGQSKLNQYENWDYGNCYVVLLLNDDLGDFQVLRAAEMDGYLGSAAVGYLDEDEFLDVAVAKTIYGQRKPGVYLVYLPGDGR